jgi:hypothetical protein
MSEKTWWGDPAPPCDFCQHWDSFPIEVGCAVSEDGWKTIAVCQPCMPRASLPADCERRLCELSIEALAWIWEGHSAYSVGELYRMALRASEQGRAEQAFLYWREAERSLADYMAD